MMMEDFIEVKEKEPGPIPNSFYNKIMFNLSDVWGSRPYFGTTPCEPGRLYEN